MKTLREIAIRRLAGDKSLMVAGHRGSAGTAPENTLSSFRHAVEAGVDLIETDVQITSDGFVVVFHDKNISRTTNGIGQVKQTDLSHFKDLDAGSWFSEQFRGEPVPLLSDVIHLIKGKCFLNIEVKNIEGDSLDDNIHRIIDVIMNEGYKDYTLFSSFYYGTLAQLKKEYPYLPTAAIRLPKDKRLPSQIASEIGCEGFVCCVEEMTDEVADDIVKSNILTGVYSIDDEPTLQEMAKKPITAVVTNFPALIIETMHKLNIPKAKYI